MDVIIRLLKDNKKEITYDKDKKINLGLTSEYKKEHKKAAIIFSFILCLLLLICILINCEDEEKLVIYLFLVLSIITTIYCLLSINEKVEIENGVITRTNCFKKKKIIGNLSDIKYFTTVENEAVVYKENYKKMFSFRYTISKTHKSFYKYLLDNHNDIIPIFKNKITCVICSFVILWVVATIFLLLYFLKNLF